MNTECLLVIWTTPLGVLQQTAPQQYIDAVRAKKELNDSANKKAGA